MEVKLQTLLSRYNMFQDKNGNIRQRLFVSKKFIFCIEPSTGEEEVYDVSKGEEADFFKRFQFQTDEGLKWIHELKR